MANVVGHITGNTYTQITWPVAELLMVIGIISSKPFPFISNIPYELILCIDASGEFFIFFSFVHCVQGAGTEEACLIDILASRTNSEVKEIIATYKRGTC